MSSSGGVYACYALAGVILLLIFIFLVKHLKNRKTHKSYPRQTDNFRTQPQVKTIATATAPNQSYDSRISIQGDLYGVPKDILPATFDLHRNGVQDMGNYILVRDLGLIQSFESSNNRSTEYQKQEPYNPNYN